MKAVDPTIQIGVGLDLSPSTANQQILSVLGNNVDFGIVHWYVNNGTSTNQVLNATDNLPGDFADLRNQINNVLGSNDLTLHMTEFGYFGTVDNPAIDGVFAANTYATVLEEGVKSAHWLELNKNSYLGDGSPVFGAAYHGIQIVSRIAQPGAVFLATTDNSTGNNDVETHATLLADGSIGLLFANLGADATRDASVTVDLSTSALRDTGTKWLYGVNQLTPLQTNETGLGNHFVVNMPYRSIVAMVIAPRLPGDFNDDGSVDAADYTVWRDMHGQSGQDLAADGTGPLEIPDGTIDEFDYALWKSNYGQQLGSGAHGSTNVPEPTTCAFLVVASVLAIGAGRPAQRRPLPNRFT